MTKDEQLCEEIFQSTTERDNNGKFIVTLPMKPNKAKLGNSYNIALKRFLQMEKKLHKDADLRKQYHDFMREYISLGHMEKVTGSESRYLDDEENQIYYTYPIMRFLRILLLQRSVGSCSMLALRLITVFRSMTH